MFFRYERVYWDSNKPRIIFQKKRTSNFWKKTRLSFEIYENSASGKPRTAASRAGERNFLKIWVLTVFATLAGQFVTLAGT